jgi:3-oxoacyl-[acyl-carrier-protein] synthase-3
MYVPEKVIDNAFFIHSPNNPYLVYMGEDESGKPLFKEERVQLTSEKIAKSTGGIQTRRQIAAGETIVDMLERAFRDSDFPADRLDGIMIGTISDDKQFPSVACRLQDRIRATNVTYTADIKAACSGFTHALDYARLRVQEQGGYCLVAGVEALTRITDYEEVNCDLFGDGCGLVVLGQAKGDEGIIATKFKSDTSGLNFIYRDELGKLRMPAGPEVFKRATSGMIELAHDLTKHAGISEEQVKLYVPHQANGRIIDYIENKIDPTKTGKIFRNISDYGNMSAATVPVALTEAIRKGRARKGDLVTLVDMGSGLAFGGALIRL